MFGERVTLYQPTVGNFKGAICNPFLAYLMFECHAPYTFRQNAVAPPKGLLGVVVRSLFKSKTFHFSYRNLHFGSCPSHCDFSNYLFYKCVQWVRIAQFLFFVKCIRTIVLFIVLYAFFVRCQISHWLPSNCS
jgi:hypothetical protein